MVLFLTHAGFDKLCNWRSHALFDPITRPQYIGRRQESVTLSYG